MTFQPLFELPGATPGFGSQREPDLTACDREPIHVPGAIQPHGAVLAARMADQLVTHASANLEQILGIPVERALGRPLHELIGVTGRRMFGTVSGAASHGSGHQDGLVLSNGKRIHLHAHQTGSLLCLDLEPAAPDRPGLPVAMVQSVLESFQYAVTRAELCELAVQGLKDLTGYDRVMAYRFMENGDGEVVAEICNAGLDRYCGLRYPAADIPLQARRLYLRQRVNIIADSHYRPVPVRSHPTLYDGTPLDMTKCWLRSVSPVHREYMRNMNTVASLTIGLAHRQELWGMLVCHHGTTRNPGPDLRAAAGMIGHVASLLLGSLSRTEAYAQRLERADTLRALIDRLAAPIPLIEAFATAEAELLDLVKAEGAIIRLSGRLLALGRTPPGQAAQLALSVLHEEAAGELMAVDHLSLRYPALAACTERGSGALLLPLSQSPVANMPTANMPAANVVLPNTAPPNTAPANQGDDVILWFRPELSQSVVWAGNPNKTVIPEPATGRISPRKSFAAWQQTVRGHSAPWREADLALVSALRTAVNVEMAQRTKAELAKLRNYDALTGLPNRRMLESALADSDLHPGTAAALLFLDLDRFKAVNDTLGHDAGDALLVEVARRLVEVAGPDTLVVRLGGDEFVVLCRGWARADVATLGERIRVVIEAPFVVIERECHISVSVGIAWDDESGGIGLLRASDMAMYAAKKSGGNQGRVFEQSIYDRAAGRFELEHDLREAIGRNDQLALVYQPVFDAQVRDAAACDAAACDTVVGFEARLRWHHPRRGWLAPDLFVPIAEKAGLILPLGNWILTETLRQGRQFQLLRPDQAIRMSVNVSPLQFAHPGFCSGLLDMLQSEGFPASALCLEVTEVGLADLGIVSVVAEVRKRGIHVALDDFGMGQSSLADLRRLPIDTVKLDRSFLEPDDGDAGVSSFIGAVTNLAHAAGLSVVAKGIETPAHLAAAKEARVDNVQGFLLGSPLTADAAATLLVRQVVSTASLATSSVGGDRT